MIFERCCHKNIALTPLYVSCSDCIQQLVADDVTNVSERSDVAQPTTIPDI